MTLHQAISEANDQHRLGLLLYLIPGYPSRKAYREVLRLTSETDFVSALEVTLPVTGGFSDHANELIRHAHKSAAAFRQSLTDIIEQFPSQKPALAVIYWESVEQVGWQMLMQMLEGKVQGVLPEWNEDQDRPYASAARAHGLEFIVCVGPWMTEEQIGRQLTSAVEQPLVYLMSAEKTGAALLPPSQLESTVASIRKFRPAAKIAAGFGVRTAGDVKALAGVPGLDAVIIGTEFLRILRHGTKDVSIYLNDLKGALSYV